MSERRESFVFYGSYSDAIALIADPMDQLVLYKAIAQYGLTRQAPDLKGVSAAMWVLIQPNIEANWRKRENGSKGGAPVGNKNAKTRGRKPKTTKEQSTDEQKQGDGRCKMVDEDGDEDLDVDENGNGNEDSLSSERAIERERDLYFEIFFFRNFNDPDKAVDNFIDHYTARQWTPNGSSVIAKDLSAKIALARGWEEKGGKPPIFPKTFVEKWRYLYDDVAKESPEHARALIRGLREVVYAGERVVLKGTTEMCEAIREHRDLVTDFIGNYLNNVGIRTIVKD